MPDSELYKIRPVESFCKCGHSHELHGYTASGGFLGCRAFMCTCECEGFSQRPVEPDLQTQLENKQRELHAAYELVLKDVSRLIEARDRFEGDNRELLLVRKYLLTQAEWLGRAPNE